MKVKRVKGGFYWHPRLCYLMIDNILSNQILREINVWEFFVGILSIHFCLDTFFLPGIDTLIELRDEKFILAKSWFKIDFFT